MSSSQSLTPMRASADVSAEPVEVPEGAPEWVTAELLQETIDVWQPYYDTALTVSDALAILSTVTELFCPFKWEQET